MKRREFLGVLGGAAAAWPAVASGQQQRRRQLIGWLGGSTQDVGARNLKGFLQGLREHGHEDGRDVEIIYRWADGDPSREPSLAKELVALKPDVIVTANGPANVTARQATTTIPIVGALTVDPLQHGLAESYNRPGRNFTGILLTVEGLASKQVDLLRQIKPSTTTVGVLMNPLSPMHAHRLREVEAGMTGSPVKVVGVEARVPSDLETAFEMLKRNRADVLVVFGDTMFFTEARRILTLAAAAQLPASHTFRQHVEQGGLMSYGVDVTQNFRRAAYFIDRILKGAKPGDLPIELPTKLELVINLKVATALGLTIPAKLLFTADEVIE